MERGLLWLPLLVMFIWLAWSGWNEYQKVEAYKVWAEDFDNAKFDIYAVLGKKAQQLTWGKPTRKGMTNLQSFSLNDVQEINLLVGDRSYEINEAMLSSEQSNGASELNGLPRKGKPRLKFNLTNREAIYIPFTDISLAAKWRNYLIEAQAQET